MRRKLASFGAEEELRTFVESVPPPAELADAQQRIEARMRAQYPIGQRDDDDISAIHDLHDWQRQQRSADVAALANRFELEHEGRLKAEATVDRMSERGWQLLIGVLVTLIAAGIIGITVSALQHPAPAPAPTHLENQNP